MKYVNLGRSGLKVSLSLSRLYELWRTLNVCLNHVP